MIRQHLLLAIGLLLLVVGDGRAQETAATRQLKAWSAEFRRDIIEVARGVYTAVGYGGSTLTMVVGDGGVVLVDTGNSIADTAEARDAFREISELLWLPDRKVLFAGDNVYRCMPNLSAIRGTPYRDVLQWANAVAQLLTKDADALVERHTRPVVGKEAVKEALTDYRDTIRFTFDKTIEGMNRGLTPDELVEDVQLRSRLAEKEYLQPLTDRTVNAPAQNYYLTAAQELREGMRKQ